MVLDCYPLHTGRKAFMLSPMSIWDVSDVEVIWPSLILRVISPSKATICILIVLLAFLLEI